LAAWLVAIAARPCLAQPAGAASDRKIASTLEIRQIEVVQEYVDQAVVEQDQLRELIMQEQAQYRSSMVRITRDLEKAIERWIADGSEENEALLKQTVAESLLAAKNAALARFEAVPEIQHKALEMETSLAGHIDEVAGLWNSSRERLEALEASASHVERMRVELRTRMSNLGLLEKKSPPPEFEEELFQLRVASHELEVTCETARVAAATLDHYHSVMLASRSNYQTIRKAGRMMGYKASSDARIFGQMAHAESLKLRFEMLADAYSQSSILAEDLASALEAMKDTGFDFQAMLKKGLRDGEREGAPVRSVPPLVDQDVMAWLRSKEEPLAEPEAGQ
jgi:hypothetical protein